MLRTRLRPSALFSKQDIEFSPCQRETSEILAKTIYMFTEALETKLEACKSVG